MSIDSVIAELNLKNIGEVSPEPLLKAGRAHDGWWDEQEKLAAEMADDDPRLVPGYHQYDYDVHTRDVIRAKGMVKARKSLAEAVSLTCAIMEKNNGRAE